MKKKMKWYKKVLLGFASLVGIVVIFCMIVITNGTCLKSSRKIDDSNKNWMSKLNDDTLLCETIIPGSHDACTYDMLWLGKCQYLDIGKQLDVGVRYFDIRVKNTGKDYVIYHGPINGVSFDPIIDTISSFIFSNPTETLILDFQHFENDAQDYVFSKVNDKLLPYAIKNETEMSDLEFVSQLTIGEARGKCLILFGYNSHCEENYIFSRNNDSCSNKGCSLDSYYDSDRNSDKSKNYIKNSIPFYVSKIDEKIQNEGDKGLFVLQGQLTDGKLIFGPYSKEKTHNKNMSDYINNLKNEEYFDKINIIMRDFMDYEKAEEIISLNFTN